MARADPFRTYQALIEGEDPDVADALASLARATSTMAGPLAEERGGPAAIERLAVALRKRRSLELAVEAYATASDPEAAAYDVFVILFFERELFGCARFDRRTLREADSERRARADHQTDARSRLEGAAVLCLQGRLAEATHVLSALPSRGSGRSDDPDVILRFIELLPAAGRGASWSRAAVDAGPWRELGFLPWDAERWARIPATPESANVLRLAGLDPERGRPWILASVSPGEVGEWRKARVAAGEAAAWRDSDFEQHEALSWRGAGADPLVASVWRAAGFGVLSFRKLGRNVVHRLTAEEARAFRDLGLDDQGTLEWLYAGVIDAADVRAHRDAGRGPDDLEEPADLPEWRRAGLSRAQRTAWLPLGLSPEEACSFSTRGFDARSARAWVEAGLPAEVAARWRHVDVDTTTAILFAQESLPPRHAKLFEDEAARRAWRAVGFRLGEAAPWLQQGFDPVHAFEWARIEAPVLEAKGLIRDGVSPGVAGRWRAAGVGNWHEVSAWATSSVPLEDASEWLGLACTAREAAHWLRTDFDAAAARRWRAVGVRTADAAARAIAEGLSPEDLERGGA